MGGDMDIISSNIAEAAASLQENGFAIARGIADAQRLRDLVSKYEQDFLPKKHDAEVRREKHPPPEYQDNPRVVHVSNMFELPGLGHLSADPRLLELASKALGGVGVRPVMNTELFDKPPSGNNSTVTPPHQDNFYFRSPMGGVALWIALDHIDADSGSVRFVRGSHKLGLRFHDWDWGPYGGFAKQIHDYTDEDDDHEMEVGTLEPGDVVIHHSLTVHHAPVNIGSSRRRGIVVNYVPELAANSLADDLYQPALTFRCLSAARDAANGDNSNSNTNSNSSTNKSTDIKSPLLLEADVSKLWPERRVLAAASVRCALQGLQLKGHSGPRRDVQAVQHRLEVLEDPVKESARLRLELGTSSSSYDEEVGGVATAIQALVQSGHAVRFEEGRQPAAVELAICETLEWPTTLSAKAALGEVQILEAEVSPSSSIAKASGDEASVNIQAPPRPGPIGFRLLAPNGFWLEFGPARPECQMAGQNDGDDDDDDGDGFDDGMADEINLKSPFLRLCCTAGTARAPEKDSSLEPSDRSQPPRTVLDSFGPLLSSVDPPGSSAWRSVQLSSGSAGRCAVLELDEDKEGRRGLFIVVGSYFGRYVGRGSKDDFKNVLCRSLHHAARSYGEAWGVNSTFAALGGCQAQFGEIVDGVFTVKCSLTQDLATLDARFQRDKDDPNLLIELGPSPRRWRSRYTSPEGLEAIFSISSKRSAPTQ